MREGLFYGLTSTRVDYPPTRVKEPDPLFFKPKNDHEMDHYGSVWGGRVGALGGGGRGGPGVHVRCPIS